MESMIDEVLSGKVVVVSDCAEDWEACQEIFFECGYGFRVGDRVRFRETSGLRVDSGGNLVWAELEYYLQNTSFQIYQAIDFILVYNARKVLES